MGRVDHRKMRYLVGVGLFAVLLGGCGATDSTDGSVLDAAQLGIAPDVQPRLTVNPPDGAVGVSPTEIVTAAVTGGQLTQVQLNSADGAPLPGVLSPDGEHWTSSRALKPATSYVLKAGSRGFSGQETTTTTRFTTLTPGQEVTGKITPDASVPVPLTQPVSVLFDKPIINRVAVERALRVSSNPSVTGNTLWRSDRELLWQPTPGWAPGSRVTVTLDIYGKQLGGGLVGAADLRTTFGVIGDDGRLALRAQSSSTPSTTTPSKPPVKPSTRAAPTRSLTSSSVRPSTALRTQPSTSRSSTSSSSSASSTPDDTSEDTF